MQMCCGYQEQKPAKQASQQAVDWFAPADVWRSDRQQEQPPREKEQKIS